LARGSNGYDGDGAEALPAAAYSIRQQKGKNGPVRPGTAVGVKAKSRALSPSSVQRPASRRCCR
jgi:hypothetical protein